MHVHPGMKFNDQVKMIANQTKMFPGDVAAVLLAQMGLRPEDRYKVDDTVRYSCSTHSVGQPG